MFGLSVGKVLKTMKQYDPLDMTETLETGVEAAVAIGDNDGNAKRLFVEQAFHLYSLPLRRYLRSSSLSDGDIEDIHQETYVRLLNQQDIMRIQPKLKGYIFTIATNLMIDRIRRNKARRISDHLPLENDTLPADTPPPEDLLSLQQSLNVIKHAIKELHPKYRQSFIMSRYMHMEHADIAVKLGVSTRTVERHIKLALDSLKRRLERN